MTRITYMSSSDLQSHIDEPMSLPIRAVVTELTMLLGRKTVAYIAGLTSVREVVSWLGDAKPRPDRDAVLRSALQAARYIALLESRESAAAWFTGTSTLFNFVSPATILRERGVDAREEVVRAARALVFDALAFLDPTTATRSQPNCGSTKLPRNERIDGNVDDR